MAILSTDRLILRPFATDDVDALQAFTNDPEVRRYLFENQILSRARVEEIIARSMASFRENGFGYFAIEVRDRASGLVGFCGFRRFEDGDSVELRYGILPEFWGEGFVSEAANAVLRFGFESCGLPSIVAVTDTPNQRSVRVMQRLGMTFDERKEHHGLDSVFYSLTADEFAAAQGT